MKKFIVFLVVIFIGITTILKAQSFGFPLNTSGWHLTQDFKEPNDNWGGYHLGEDYVANSNIELPVYATSNGIVKHVQNHPKSNQKLNYGYLVIIEHALSDGSKVCSVYGHMRAANITTIGKSVIKGELIGYLSNDPNENGGYSFTHLHFGIRSGGYSTVLDSDGGWRYRGYGPSSIRDLWYDSGDFVATHQNTSIPTLSTPNDNAEFTKGSVISFSWTSVTNAAYYEIWIDNNNGFGSPEVGFHNDASVNWVNDGIVSSNSFTLTTSMQNQLPQNLYYWKVRALDNNMNPITDWSSNVRSFKLYDPLIPPTILTPSDNAEFTKGSDISFSWTSVNNASFYEIWIDNNNGFGSPEIGFNNGMSSNWINYGIVSSNNFTLTTTGQNQLPQNLYYWKVRALDSSKNPITDWSSDVRTFKLFNLFSPPTLSSPSDNTKLTKGNDIVFSWSILPNAANYEIWIDNNSGFGSPEVGFYNGASLNWVNNGIVSANSFTLTTTLQDQLPQNLYYWKVRALDGNLNPITEWSNNIRSFELLENQGSRTININTAGTLSSYLTSDELNTITNLTITGTLDARDFTTMRDAMPALAVLDLSATSIAAYTGPGGTGFYSNIYPANELPESSFKYTNSLKTIKLPLSITSIGTYAFRYCHGLSEITIPGLVSKLGSEPFSYCNQLTAINVDVNNPTFSDVDGVLFKKDKTELIKWPNGKVAASYVIPSSVVTIKISAFEGCSGIVSITIPNSVKSIESYSFRECSNLSDNITIPSSVTSIGVAVFNSCPKITKIKVDVNNSNYSDLDGVLFNIDKTSLVEFPNGKVIDSYTIPSSVISIKTSAFYNCRGLTGALAIPGSVSTIDRFAFAYCTGITGSLTLPSSVITIGEYAFEGCSGINNLTIPNSVEAIGDKTFNCSGLQNIIINKILPPTITANTFLNVNKTSCILHVPYGTASLYHTANQWKDFTNIVESSQGFLLGSNTAKILNVAGSSTTVEIKANVSWTAGSDQLWLTVSPGSGSVNGILTLTSTSQSQTLRTATVTVSSSGYASQTITVSETNGTYCTAGSTATSAEYISNVAIGSINQASARGTAGYQDYTLQITTMQIGVNTTATITVTNPYSTDQVLIWVDWNQDGDFDEAGENVYASTGSFASPHTTANFAPPAGAKTGITRMRIRLHDTSNGSNATSCGNASYGEVEDYTINVAAACIPPTTKASAFTSSALANNSMTVGWIRGNGSAVLVVARAGSAVNSDPVNGTTYTASAAFGNGTQIGTGNYVVYSGTGTSVNLTTLTSGTTYYFSIFEYTSASNCFLTPALIENVTTTGNSVQVIVDELNGSTIGNATGITYTTTTNGQGAVFNRINNSRIEYNFDSQIPREGTLELLIKVESGYYYNNYSLNENLSSAQIWGTDCQGGDVYWPGAMKIVASNDGSLSLVTETAYGQPEYTVLSATSTAFRFNEFHAIGISYGNQGQYLSLDGNVVASNTNYTLPLTAAGNFSQPMDMPTIGKTVSSFWDYNQYDGGFNGIVDKFRTSTKQKDWFLNISGTSYCAAGSTDASEYISNVAIDSTMQIGVNISATITVTNPYSTDQVLIWIDWNQDGDFDEAGENVYASTGSFASPHTTANFAPPAGAKTGITRMRIRLHDTINGPNATPCGNSGYGEVEDYSIKVINATATPTVSDGGSIRIYPNPVTESFKIEGIDGNVSVSLIDLNGRELLSKRINNQESISVGNLSKGMYIVKIITTEGTVERKFVKK